MQTKPIFLLYCCLAMFFLHSCVPQKQVSSSKKELSNINASLENYNQSLKILNETRDSKEKNNQIDDTANHRIRKFIDITQAEIDTMIKNNSILIGETIVDKQDWDRLRNALSSTRNSTKQINNKILFLNDLVSRNLVLKLDQDVVFEPGQYRVSNGMAENITRQFEPAAREIDLFIKKYPDIPLSLVITAKGYSDATIVPPGSQLQRELKQRLNLTSQEPDNKELNKELSRARAEAVKLLFQKFASTRPDSKAFQSKVLYLYEGKGEMPPDPKVTDYRTKDPRRRVVLLYWSVFPE